MNPAVLEWALAQPAGSLWLALAHAYASGTTRVRHAQREVEYRSLSEIERILSTGYASANAAARRPLQTVAQPLALDR